ncbi:tetrapeptide repeat homeobox protein 2 [Camelus dromedarius]|uniref:tetrapeptide repeat homeobox protein 2 n=1 Tax=Camelus dromedarius TaxID=9838 RepID=UPI0031193E83
MDPARCSGPLKRQRQERTVYTKEQLEMLEEHFKKNDYPGYQERLGLAAKLNLEEHKVQVWFKNRRAKRSRLERLSKGGDQRACDAPGAPGPTFPEEPGFRSPAPPSPAGMLAAPDPGAFGQGPARWAPARGAQAEVPAASAPVPAPASVPAPAPVWPQDPSAANFCPGPLSIPDFANIFSYRDPSRGPPSPLMSGYQKDDDSEDENDLGPGRLLSL